jgi:hypothetical protein
LSASDLYAKAVKLIILRYSRGDAIIEMRPAVEQIIEMLQLYRRTLASVELEKDVRQMNERLDLYRLQQAFALLAFLVSLRSSTEDIQHALTLIGHAGEDTLLDRVARHFGDTKRPVSEHSKFPKMYDALATVIDAPSEKQPELLKKYVAGWYKSMKPATWYDNHKAAVGAYYGYWCFEAALVAMLWNIDDSALAQHENYPYDLVRYYRVQPV